MKTPSIRIPLAGAGVAVLLLAAVALLYDSEAPPTRAFELGPGKMPNQPDEALTFYLRQRLPAGAEELPLEDLYAARSEILVREAALGPSRGASGPAGIQGWQSIGPGNVGGRTRAIVVDSTNPNVMYGAGVAGGVFKSTDAGVSWTPTDDLMLNLAVCTLVMDPTNPNVLYAGTGEGYGAGIFVRGLGIFKSTDAGATWTQLPSTAPAQAGAAFHYVNKLAISPNASNRIYAATRHGVFKSSNSGASWNVVLANPRYDATPPTSNGSDLGCLDIALRSDTLPDVIFAAFGGFQKDGLFRSDDGGTTWTEYVTPSYQGRMTLAIAPSDNDRIYVGMADNGGLAQFGRLADVWRADDGVTFASSIDLGHPLSPWLFSYVSIATGCVTGYPIYSQGWYDQTITVDPTDPDVLFLGGINLYRSDDAGTTFGLMGYWMTYDPPTPQHVHVDQHTIVPHPGWNGTTNQTLFVGNDGGLWRTANAKAVTSQEECPLAPNPGPPPDVVWEHFENDYATTQFYHGAVAQTADVFIAGAQDNSVHRVTSTATPNGWEELFRGDGGYCAIDHTNEDVMYSEIQGFPTIRKSTDGGDTFADATAGITDTDGLFIAPFAMDPSDPLVLWTGGSRPWRTTNGAASWTRVGPNFTFPNTISAIAIAPADGNVVYLGFDNGYVVRSANALSASPTWALSTGGLPGGYISSVAVDPLDPDVAYVTHSTIGVSHIYRTTNGGGSWISIDGIAATGVPDIPVHWIAVRPSGGQQLYAGTEFGVFASDDGGATWLPANDGLAHTVVETLAFQGENRLVAFTFGRGAFLTHLDPDPTSAPEVVAAAEPLRLAAAPNPFRSGVEIEAILPHPGLARLTIHDVQGRLVTVLADEVHAAGRLTRTWNGRDRSGAKVAAGTYLARVEAGGALRATKIVRVR